MSDRLDVSVTLVNGSSEPWTVADYAEKKFIDRVLDFSIEPLEAGNVGRITTS